MKVTCIVDNTAQASSRFWGEHGLSFVIETNEGRVLFDTGQSGTVLLHNLQVAGIEPASIDAVALSHAHRDHTGGLSVLLQQTGVVPLYAHPDLFRERFSRRDAGIEKIGPPMGREDLLRRADLHLNDRPQEIFPEVYTTGEISSRPEFEGRSARHLIREGNRWVADPYHDDMALVLIAAEGLVVVCGCCHAGLLNTLQHVRTTFDREVVLVLGGMHLGDMNEEQMQHIVQALQSYGEPRLYPNHCTGQRAYVALAAAFSNCVAPCPAGTELVFQTPTLLDGDR
jgi:7,8-dihydropterin-6-yl-methyl-4-(beta-D-ribofuranosyl)aminobenzene 5'-phosphate synthase